MRIEMHCHTYYSRCSLLSPSSIIEICRKKGLNGVCITDHRILLGAEEVEKANSYQDFKVYKGIEFNAKEGHILGIGLKKQIMFNKKRNSTIWLLDEIHRQGGVAVLAHPFSLTRFNAPNIEKLSHLKFDAIEVVNGRNIFSIENNQANKLANNLKLPKCVGSDAHFSWEIGNHVVECNDFLNDLRKGKIKYTCTNRCLNISAAFNQILSFLLSTLRKFLGLFAS